MLNDTMCVRAGFYGKLIRVLDVCAIEANGNLSEKENTRLMEMLDAEKIQEYKMEEEAKEYLIDREALKIDKEE